MDPISLSAASPSLSLGLDAPMREQSFSSTDKVTDVALKVFTLLATVASTILFCATGNPLAAGAALVFGTIFLSCFKDTCHTRHIHRHRHTPSPVIITPRPISPDIVFRPVYQPFPLPPARPIPVIHAPTYHPPIPPPPAMPIPPPHNPLAIFHTFLPTTSSSSDTAHIPVGPKPLYPSLPPMERHSPVMNGVNRGPIWYRRAQESIPPIEEERVQMKR